MGGLGEHPESGLCFRSLQLQNKFHNKVGEETLINSDRSYPPEV